MPSTNIARTPITVPFVEVAMGQSSPEEQVTQNSFRATRTLQCAWNDRLALADELLCGFQVQLGALNIEVGQPYPHRDRCYAKSVAIRNFNGDGDYNGDAAITGCTSYEYAHLTVSYEPSDFDPNNAANGSALNIAEESIDPVGEFLNPNEDKPLYLAGENTPIPKIFKPGFYSRSAHWTYSINRVTKVPPGWFNKMGCVNDADVTSTKLGYTFPAGTLLYLGMPLSRTITTASAGAWKAALKFFYRPEGWNKFPNSIGQYKNIYSKIATLQDPSNLVNYYQSCDFLTDLNLVL